jgi:hypothetical protein
MSPNTQGTVGVQFVHVGQKNCEGVSDAGESRTFVDR